MGKRIAFVLLVLLVVTAIAAGWGITKSPVWKVAIKNKIPEDLRKIATGEAPLWTTEGAPATTRVAKGR
jgi:hypothetical protein